MQEGADDPGKAPHFRQNEGDPMEGGKTRNHGHDNANLQRLLNVFDLIYGAKVKCEHGVGEREKAPARIREGLDDYPGDGPEERGARNGEKHSSKSYPGFL